MEQHWRKWATLLSPVGVVLFSVLFAGAISLGSPVSVYLTATLLLGGCLSLYLQLANREDITLLKNRNREFLIGIFCGTALLALLARTVHIGVPQVFYLVLVVITILLAGKIATNPAPSDIGIILAFAVAIRASYWYAASVIGRDVRKHIAFTEYIVETGQIIPLSINYYHYYPIGHIVAAILKIVTSIPMKVAYFLSIGGGALVGIVILTPFIRRLLPDNHRGVLQIILFSLLYLSVAPFHIRWSNILYIQSLTLLFFPLAMLPLVNSGKRFLSIGLISLIALSLTHNIPAMLLAVFALGYFGLKRIENRIVGSSSSYFIYYPVVIIVSTLSYWIYHFYLQLQVGRVLQLFDSDGLVTSGMTSSGEAGLLTSPILHTAFGLLFVGVVLTACGIYLLHEYGRQNARKILIGFPLNYYLSASIIFVVISGATMMAFDSRAVRLIPYAVLIAAPIVGYFLTELVHRKPLGVFTAIFFICMLPAMIFLSAAGPAHSPGTVGTEERPGLYKLYHTSSQEAVIEFAQANVRPVSAAPYTYHSLRLRSVLGTTPDWLHVVRLLTGDGLSSCEGWFVYHNYFDNFIESGVDETNSVIYSTTRTDIVSCR
jgi:hypothetical protein